MIDALQVLGKERTWLETRILGRKKNVVVGGDAGLIQRGQPVNRHGKFQERDVKLKSLRIKPRNIRNDSKPHRLSARLADSL